MKIIAILTFAAAAAVALAAQANVAVPTENDPVAAKREVELASKLRCLVCQNQTIAESNAGLAVDLRNQVREQIAAGRSDREIVDYMTARYGDFVLYEPPFKPLTVLLWFGPLLLLAIGIFIAMRVVRARRSLAAEAPLSEADRVRAEKLLQGGGSAS